MLYDYICTVEEERFGKSYSFIVLIHIPKLFITLPII